MIVDVMQVVPNNEQSLARITAAEVAEGFANVRDPFATTKQATEAVGVHIIESQKLFRSLSGGGRLARIRQGCFCPGPSNTTDRFQIQRAPFRRKQNYCAARRATLIERPDEFFLRSNAGSFDVFQVRNALGCKSFAAQQATNPLVGHRRQQFFVDDSIPPAWRPTRRRTVIPVRRDSIMRHRSVHEVVQHVEWADAPSDWETCSKVPNPLSLKRWTQSYATVKWQPTRSAAVSRLNPRPNLVDDSVPLVDAERKEVRSLSLDRSTRCSPRVRGRSFKCRAISPSPHGRIANIRLYKLEGTLVVSAR